MLNFHAKSLSISHRFRCAETLSHRYEYIKLWGLDGERWNKDEHTA